MYMYMYVSYVCLLCSCVIVHTCIYMYVYTCMYIHVCTMTQLHKRLRVGSLTLAKIEDMAK